MTSSSDDSTWAVTEFAQAELGDLRRPPRLVDLATVLAQHPGASLPEAGADSAMLKAASRFFDHDAIDAQEEQPPAQREPIEWLLLTTVAVATVADAVERVAWYAGRWGIEVWHKILKSGCRIEARQLETAERLQQCMTLYSVIAWRIFYATMLARAIPDMPCTVLLEVAEWQALYCAIHRTPHPPEAPPALGQAVRGIAQLGGFVGRRRGDEPGPIVLWRGFQHLTDLTAMYCILRPPSETKNVSKT
jgi:hypothetical protein